MVILIVRTSSSGDGILVWLLTEPPAYLPRLRVEWAREQGSVGRGTDAVAFAPPTVRSNRCLEGRERRAERVWLRQRKHCDNRVSYRNTPEYVGWRRRARLFQATGHVRYRRGPV
ncbi:predicted protein [Histoplasma capsulatum var. duboisii H88]|uniref:Predicted protein n=2 Tax=Ajellomyces capsulatus TaxID=5037 RepID=F0UB63_AJEC8|nr:predicted protein [Histoplasma capsulatum H143]EGC43817.1 predicted protein [Histoplasma capsulatum var. duboisii H88]